MLDSRSHDLPETLRKTERKTPATRKHKIPQLFTFFSLSLSLLLISKYFEDVHRRRGFPNDCYASLPPAADEGVDGRRRTTAVTWRIIFISPTSLLFIVLIYEFLLYTRLIFHVPASGRNVVASVSSNTVTPADCHSNHFSRRPRGVNAYTPTVLRRT